MIFKSGVILSLVILQLAVIPVALQANQNCTWCFLGKDSDYGTTYLISCCSDPNSDTWQATTCNSVCIPCGDCIDSVDYDNKRVFLVPCCSDSDIKSQIKGEPSPYMEPWWSHLEEDFNPPNLPIFEVNPNFFDKMKEENVPVDDIFNELGDLQDKTYTIEEEFLKAVETRIGKNKLGQYKSLILEHTRKPVVKSMQEANGIVITQPVEMLHYQTIPHIPVNVVNQLKMISPDNEVDTPVKLDIYAAPLSEGKLIKTDGSITLKYLPVINKGKLWWPVMFEDNTQGWIMNDTLRQMK